MGLITKEFFIGDINIPNTDTKAVAERLDIFIEDREQECLRKLLGYPLYKAYVEERGRTQRMKDLVNGKEYTLKHTVNEINQWVGLVHGDQSLIAYYIYYWFQSSNAAQTSSINTNIPKVEASQEVSPMDKMLFSWRRFHQDAWELLTFLWNNRSTYPEFTTRQYWISRSFSKPLNAFGI